MCFFMAHAIFCWKIFIVYSGFTMIFPPSQKWKPISPPTLIHKFAKLCHQNTIPGAPCMSSSQSLGNNIGLRKTVYIELEWTVRSDWKTLLLRAALKKQVSTWIAIALKTCSHFVKDFWNFMKWCGRLNSPTWQDQFMKLFFANKMR